MPTEPSAPQTLVQTCGMDRTRGAQEINQHWQLVTADEPIHGRTCQVHRRARQIPAAHTFRRQDHPQTACGTRLIAPQCGHTNSRLTPSYPISCYRYRHSRSDIPVSQVWPAAFISRPSITQQGNSQRSTHILSAAQSTTGPHGPRSHPTKRQITCKVSAKTQSRSPPANAISSCNSELNTLYTSK